MINKLIYLFVISISLTFLSCDPDETAKEEGIVSVIQPKPVFVTGTQRIDLLSPLPAASESADITFVFDARSMAKATLLVFKREVSFSEISSGLDADCVAGASTLAGHSWNGTTLQFTSSSTTSQLYACVTGNANEFLSQTTRQVRPTTSSNYFWVILGYNKYFVLTHSSSINKFTIP